ncbi:hypothetical protein [Frankia sp. CiP1_Cm_nod1]|uniref:hypothetical protein n=1 Tax=Frankia sp. CiP1_Cm_nod1 TaxID=2897160 RepID=UPI0020244CF7
MSEDGEVGVLRVPDAELDFDENMVYTHRGALFTGIGYEEVPGRGISEIGYRRGLQERPARDWYPSGKIKGESYFRENVPHGAFREFDEGGNLRFDAVYEYGILVSSVRTDHSGAIIESFEIDSSNSNFLLLERLRREKSW